MELWTIFRCWCLVYVVAVTLRSEIRTAILVDAAVSRHRTTNEAISSRSARFLLPDINSDCEELSEEELVHILGPAYNTRYMSINSPKSEDTSTGVRRIPSKKRGAEDEELLFAVDDTFAHEISEKPAWTVNHAALSGDGQQPAGGDHRQRRSTRDQKSPEGGKLRPWECKPRIKWVNLGQDSFPRFLRTVECTKSSCFYQRYTCQPRSFTVKMLRRRRGHCVRVDGPRNATATEITTEEPQYKTNAEGQPVGLRELWVWEERAVNFCCDCAPTSSQRY